MFFRSLFDTFDTYESPGHFLIHLILTNLSIPLVFKQPLDSTRSLKVSVEKEGELIFLRKERNERRLDTKYGSRNQILVKQALTDQSFPIDEKEKDFNIIQVTFSDFALLLLAEVDAVDSDGHQVKIAAKSTYNKVVDMWSISLVSGMEKIVIGTVEMDGPSDSELTRVNVTGFTTLDTNICAVQELLEKSEHRHDRIRDKVEKFPANSLPCFNWLETILSFILDQTEHRERFLVHIKTFGSKLSYRVESRVGGDGW